MAIKPPSTASRPEIVNRVSMAHHVRVLVEAGLIKVVQTRQVRVMTERYYGRVARTYMSVSKRADKGQALGVELLGIPLPHSLIPLE